MSATPKILVVDDTPLNVMLLGDLLIVKGYPVCNLSARLCTEAKPGQVLVSQRVYGRIEPGVRAEPAGEAVLKGFHRPVPMFNVIALK